MLKITIDSGLAHRVAFLVSDILAARAIVLCAYVSIFAILLDFFPEILLFIATRKYNIKAIEQLPSNDYDAPSQFLRRRQEHAGNEPPSDGFAIIGALPNSNNSTKVAAVL